MSTGANLTPLLIRVRGSGVTLAVEGDALAVSPRGALTPELRAELVRHKPELLELLAWRERYAYALIKDALAYLAEFYLEAGSPDCDLSAMLAPEEEINEAFASRDMHLLRVAVRGWVEAGLGAFREMEGARGAA
jgi:TubC N-terminal docking domain